MLVDTSCVCDKTIKGGRLGVYVFSQESVIWSNMRYSCLTAEKELDIIQCKNRIN